MTHTEKAIQLIDWLLHKSKATHYRINQVTGVGLATLDRIQSDSERINNLQIATAQKLEVYATQLKKEMDNMTKIQHDNKEYTLTQEAYIDGPANGTPFYRALAVDQDGKNYEVFWDVREDWEEIEDEQEMCDWSNPASVDPA